MLLYLLSLYKSINFINMQLYIQTSILTSSGESGSVSLSSFFCTDGFGGGAALWAYVLSPVLTGSGESSSLLIITIYIT